MRTKQVEGVSIYGLYVVLQGTIRSSVRLEWSLPAEIRETIK